MVTIVVRSGKDVSAVKYSISRFYGNDPAIRVESLKGARKCDEIASKLREIASSRSDIFITLLGEESSHCVSIVKREVPPNVYVYVVPRKKVRNLRLEHLAWEIAKAKSMARNTVYWIDEDRAYALYRKMNGIKVEIGIDPAFDTFFLMGKGVKVLKSLAKTECSLPLFVREYGGFHRVFCGPHEICRLEIPDEFKEIKVTVLDRIITTIEPSLDRTIDINRDLAKLVIDRGVRILTEFSKGFRKVIVPFSGGKDSTLSLAIACKAFDPKDVIAVYVDTGLEFPQNLEYVDSLASRFGVELIKVRAPVKEAIEERREFPTHTSRWCTEIKLQSLEKFVRSLGSKVLVVIGDRDAESRARAWRPTVRDSGDVRYVAPIKPWSTAQVQVTLISLGIPMNPLYECGFYRIGCYTCPSLRSWEYYVMKYFSHDFNSVLSNDLFKRFEQTKRAKE